MSSASARLLARAAFNGDCLEWTGARVRGYGRIQIDGRLALCHRIAYELWTGPIPEKLEIDHLCRNRACFNPDHLEAVTKAENLRRAQPFRKVKTECVNGHRYTPENTYVCPRGYRQCRECQRDAVARYARGQRTRSTQTAD